LTTEEKIDPITGIVDTLAASVVAHDGRTESLITVAEQQGGKQHTGYRHSSQPGSTSEPSKTCPNNGKPGSTRCRATENGRLAQFRPFAIR
jgi:hypothetical protein